MSYIYLISSLPMLVFGEQAPFSFNSFLGRCKELLPPRDFEVLKGLFEPEAGFVQPALKKWRGFNRSLKNALVKVRASYKRADASKYLRGDDYIDPAIARAALSAHRNPSPLEGERMLDLLRWRFLDDLSLGHYFDLDFLVCYAQKLIILERWQRINTIDKEAAIEKALE